MTQRRSTDLVIGRIVGLHPDGHAKVAPIDHRGIVYARQRWERRLIELADEWHTQRSAEATDRLIEHIAKRYVNKGS